MHVLSSSLSLSLSLSISLFSNNIWYFSRYYILYTKYSGGHEEKNKTFATPKKERKIKWSEGKKKGNYQVWLAGFFTRFRYL